MSILGYTTNYSLRKINFNSPYWQDDLNSNFDVIDSVVKGVQTVGSNIPFVVATGSTNAYVLTYSPAITAYTSGMEISFQPNAANTGAATVNVNGLGAKALTRGGVALENGVLSSGGYVRAIYNGTNFVVVDPAEVDVQVAGNITPSQLSEGHPTWDTNSNLSAVGTINGGKVTQAGKQVLSHAGAYTSGSITVSTGNPTGGSDGDIWIKVA